MSDQAFSLCYYFCLCILQYNTYGESLGTMLLVITDLSHLYVMKLLRVYFYTTVLVSSFCRGLIVVDCRPDQTSRCPVLLLQCRLILLCIVCTCMIMYNLCSISFLGALHLDFLSVYFLLADIVRHFLYTLVFLYTHVLYMYKYCDSQASNH